MRNDFRWRHGAGTAGLVIAIATAACSPMTPLTTPPERTPNSASPASPAASPSIVPEPGAPSSNAIATATSPHKGERFATFGRERVSSDARAIADWVVDSADNHGLPFIIVDKANAKVLVFDADGVLRGASPALLGAAKGDDSVPGIGERPIADIRPEERTTPAGRFAAEMGVNAKGEDILWVDYDDAVSMHRVRATNPAERRLQRLASSTPMDNRISYGCINLPAAFYDTVVKPAFQPHNGIVYVLPETRSAQALFGAYPVTRNARRHVAQK
ncbi:MAG: hypothetical protein ABIS28_01120 [Caldimonas sp.]